MGTGVALFGKLAEYTRTLAKGSYVTVQGAVRTREFERDAVSHGLQKGVPTQVGKRDRAGCATDRDRDPKATENWSPPHDSASHPAWFCVVEIDAPDRINSLRFASRTRYSAPKG